MELGNTGSVEDKIHLNEGNDIINRMLGIINERIIVLRIF
jgi:hypothetical protein